MSLNFWQQCNISHHTSILIFKFCKLQRFKMHKLN